MNRKRILGVILILAGLVLIVLASLEVKKTVTLSGLTVGSTATYEPPFAFHGPLVVLAGIAGIVCFLIGLYLVSPGRNK